MAKSKKSKQGEFIVAKSKKSKQKKSVKKYTDFKIKRIVDEEGNEPKFSIVEGKIRNSDGPIEISTDSPDDQKVLEEILQLNKEEKIQSELTDEKIEDIIFVAGNEKTKYPKFIGPDKSYINATTVFGEYGNNPDKILSNLKGLNVEEKQSEENSIPLIKDTTYAINSPYALAIVNIKTIAKDALDNDMLEDVIKIVDSLKLIKNLQFKVENYIKQIN